VIQKRLLQPDPATAAHPVKAPRIRRAATGFNSTMPGPHRVLRYNP